MNEHDGELRIVVRAIGVLIIYYTPYDHSCSLLLLTVGCWLLGVRRQCGVCSMPQSSTTVLQYYQTSLMRFPALVRSSILLINWKIIPAYHTCDTRPNNGDGHRKRHRPVVRSQSLNLLFQMRTMDNGKQVHDKLYYYYFLQPHIQNGFRPRIPVDP
jgi:hypothetical protein